MREAAAAVAVAAAARRKDPLNSMQSRVGRRNQIMKNFSATAQREKKSSNAW
jgi:hypothetical protein